MTGSGYELPSAYRGKVWDTVAELLDPVPDIYWDDPDAWARANIPAWRSTDYQTDIMKHLATERRACVRGPHGLGKSGMAAIATLWFADTRDKAGMDWKVVTTASVWRQLRNYLWPEIHKWGKKIVTREFSTRYELLTMELKLKTGSAFPAASDDPANIEGAHASQILYIVDEGKNVIPGTWDAIEGAMSTGDCYVLAISTPGSPQGRFFEIQQRRPGTEDWWVRHVTLEEAIKAGRISRAWADQRKRQWGEYSEVYQNRVLGEFSTVDSDGIIPLTWVEAANDRWEDLKDTGLLDASPLTCVASDIATEDGKDATIIVLRKGNVVTEIRALPRGDTMEATGWVKSILDGAPKGPGIRPPYAVIDVIGVGAGVVDRLREQRIRVDSFNASSKSTRKDRSGELGFINRRAEAWWKMRELLDPTYGSKIALPPDDTLIGDLTAPRWEAASSGSIKIESKDDIKKRLGRSPDVGDAVVMAFNSSRPNMDIAGTRPFSIVQLGGSKWR
jgi:hypothetical protein